MHLKIDTLFLADVLENFRKMCLKFFHLDHVKCLSAPGLALQAPLKRTEIKLELLSDIDLLSMVKKESEEEHIMQVINMLKLITNIWKIMIQIIIS